MAFAGLRIPDGIVAEEGTVLPEGWDAAPAEVDHASRFAEKRRREFLTGRTLARRALRRLGIEAPAILPDERRAPRWPEGAFGSITHTGDYCLAIAGHAPPFQGMAIDVQEIAAMKETFAAKVLTPEERPVWEALPPGTGEGGRIGRLALIFSAKETFYKLQYPLTRQWLGFQQVAAEEFGPGWLALRLKPDLGGYFRAGERFLIQSGFEGGRVGTFASIEYPS
jgi:4'-phosphopantetheinyl transferase EntD